MPARELSDGGARIVLAAPRFVPQSFWLIAITSGLAYRARIVWRHDDRLGVQFGEPTDLRDPLSFNERRLQKLWRQSR